MASATQPAGHPSNERHGGESELGDRRIALVMIHDFALDARMWVDQVDALATDFRVLTVDLPGFGAQGRALGDVRSADEIGRAMDACGLVRAHVLASGFGAAVAVDFALLAPLRVESLTLVSPVLLGRRLGIESWSRCAATCAEGDRILAIESYLDDPMFASLRKDEDLFEFVRQIMLDYGGGHWTHAVTSVFAEEDPAARLAEIKVPAMIVSGDEDLASMKQMADAYLRGLPSARHETLAGAGHLPNLEAVSAFNALLRAFLLPAAPPA